MIRKLKDDRLGWVKRVPELGSLSDYSLVRPPANGAEATEVTSLGQLSLPRLEPFVRKQEKHERLGVLDQRRFAFYSTASAVISRAVSSQLSGRGREITSEAFERPLPRGLVTPESENIRPDYFCFLGPDPCVFETKFREDGKGFEIRGDQLAHLCQVQYELCEAGFNPRIYYLLAHYGPHWYPKRGPNGEKRRRNLGSLDVDKQIEFPFTQLHNVAVVPLQTILGIITIPKKGRLDELAITITSTDLARCAKKTVQEGGRVIRHREQMVQLTFDDRPFAAQPHWELIFFPDPPTDANISISDVENPF